MIVVNIQLFDSAEVMEEKAATLARWLTEAKHVVVHTGAGVSTAAGEYVCVCVSCDLRGDQTASNKPIQNSLVVSNLHIS